jgi:hypothetical protein
VKWEYLTVFLNDGDRHIMRVQKINDQELPYWKTGPAWHEYINKLGEEGWELVRTHRSDHYGVPPWTWIFKRPKP